MANERLETNGILNNQADGTQIYLGGAWRTIAFIKFACPAGTTDIIAGVALQKIYVLGFQFSCDTDATTFKWVEETTGDLTNAQTFMKGGGEVVFPYKTLLFQTAVVLKKLQGTATVGTVTGTVWYVRF